MHKYRRILQYARRYRFTFILIFLLTLVASAFSALQPWPIKLLVDHVLDYNPVPAIVRSILSFFGLRPTPTVFLLIGTVGGLALFALNSILEVGLTRAWIITGRRMVYDLAEDLFARLQRRSLLFHSRNSVGEIMSRITRDSWCVYQLFDTLFFAPGHALLTMIGMLFLMTQLDGTLTLLSFVIAPLMVGASFLMGKPLRAAGHLRREIEGRIQSHIQQTLTGIPVVQAFAQEEREQERFAQFADAAIEVQQKTTLIGSINSLGSGLITTLATGVVLWVAASHVMIGRLTIGGMLIFLFYLSSLQAQMKIFANIYTALQGFHASVERALDVLEGEPELADRPGAVQLAAKPNRLERRSGPRHDSHEQPRVQFENVTFGYQPGQSVLRDISLAAGAGQTLAIVGPTGAGKSTLVNLIPRFFDPWEGRVLMDGMDLRDLQLKSLRAHIALVLQEPFLFPVSIAENIAYGRPDATRSETEAAARAANAHDFIMHLPQGYETSLGERGATLSGGERQRLSIARAILKNAPILLLDEPTSALDAQTEGLLLEALERLKQGRTTFIIAHRLSSIRSADQIAVLQDGRIQETGTHQQLMALGKIYAQLYDLQFGEKKTPALQRTN